METPIEKLANLINDAHMKEGDTYAAEVLVPEQCMEAWINGKGYHLSLTELPA